MPCLARSSRCSTDRFCVIDQSGQGCLTLQVKSGAVYQGIFHTAQLDNADINVVLQMAKLIKEGEQQASTSPAVKRPIKELIIKSGDLMSLTAKDVRMGADDLSGPAEDAFGTDAAISKGRGG